MNANRVKQLCADLRNMKTNALELRGIPERHCPESHWNILVLLAIRVAFLFSASLTCRSRYARTRACACVCRVKE